MVSKLESRSNSADNATMITRLLLLLVFIATTVNGAIQPPMLQDQYGVSSGLASYPGEAVLAIVVSGRKLRWVGRWEETIRVELPEITSLRVADITDKPRPEEAQVAETLRKRAPANVSILINLQNHWATLYQLDTREPCLVLFDREHNVVAQFRGRPNDELADEVLTALREYFPSSQAAARL